MRELALFSGAGGGLLGTYLLGWQPIGYVEWNDFCQRVIAARIADGILPTAPIFGDIRAFIRDGYAASYSGLVDVVTGGFPCQPFSVAGKRLGIDDSRNMWPATVECIRVVRPRFLLLENVPGLLTSGYFGTILGDLAASGYDVRWRVLSAAELGAPHQRDRLWLAAHANGRQQRGGQRSQRRAHQRGAHAAGSGAEGSPAFVADAERQPLENDQQHDFANPDPDRPGWWTTEPDVGRVAHGVAARLDRLTALGNGQVPAVVLAAWRLLNGETDQP